MPTFKAASWRSLPARVVRRMLRVLRTLLRRLGERAPASPTGTPPAPPHPPSPAVATPRVPGPPSQRPSDLRILGVLDTFSASSFAPDCDLHTDFGPQDWDAALEAHRPHLLLVESAWQGNGGRWQYHVGSYAYDHTRGLPHLTELVDRCRRQGIPTVFWNKEDPVHFDKFAEAARLFDVVLTTDADRIDAYRQLDGARAEVVAALPFAAQPALHHPVGAPVPRLPHPVFAGTFYRNRHPQRRVQLEMLLDAAREQDLVIFDRMGGEKTETAGFPDRFDPHVHGGLPYDQMVEAYRRYRVFLNTNSVTASPTMFSRRVFELLASGTPVISTPSVGMEAMLGSVVRTVRDETEATSALHELLHDDDVWQTASAAGLALVHGHHTVAHRLATIARHAGITIDPERDHAVTLAVTDPSRRDAAAHAVTQAVGDGAAVTSPDEAVAATTPWVLVTDGGDRELRQLPALLPARRYATAEALGAPTGPDRGSLHAYVDELLGTPALVRTSVVAAWDPAAEPGDRARSLRAVGARSFAALPSPAL